MDSKRAKELLPFITAFANGEALQWRRGYRSRWLDVVRPGWEAGTEYRFKPKAPRKFKLAVSKHDGLIVAVHRLGDRVDETHWEMIEVVEVLKDETC